MSFVRCASGCVVECQICNWEATASNLGRIYFAPRSTQPSVPPGSVNEYRYQLRLGRQRHLQLIKCWPSCATWKGVCGGAKNFGSTLLQPARSVCVSGRFFHYVMYSVDCLCFVVVICLKHGLMFAGAGAEDLCWLLLVDIHHSSSSTSTPLTHCLYSSVYI